MTVLAHIPDAIKIVDSSPSSALVQIQNTEYFILLRTHNSYQLYTTIWNKNEIIKLTLSSPLRQY